MNKLTINGKTGQFQRGTIEHGDYLEGYFLDREARIETIDGVAGPVPIFFCPFRITLGPNLGEEDVELVLTSTLQRSRLLIYQAGVKISISLKQQTYQKYVFYIPEVKELDKLVS